MTSTVPVQTPAIVLQRFPLVPRPQPDCPALMQRVCRVAQLATQSDPSRVAAAHNLAAPTAADCGQLDLARDMCLLHHHRYPTSQPWTTPRTRLAFEPLVNPARLHAHTGNPDAALELLRELLAAHQQADDTVLDRRGRKMWPCPSASAAAAALKIRTDRTVPTS